MRRHLATITVTLLALLAAACGGAEQPTGATSPTPGSTATVSASEFSTCTNAQDGYRISYPDSWQTNRGEVAPTCRVFDPEPIELERGTEIPFDVAVTLDVVDKPMSELDDSDLTTEVLDRSELRIAGRDAVSVRFRSTGAGLLPEGKTGHRFVVQLREGQRMLASTYDVDERPLEANVETMRRMLETLEATPEGADSPAASAPPFHADTAPDTAEGSGAPINVTGIDLAAHEGYDRVVFEIGGEGTPGWHVEYVDRPTQQGSGQPVDVAGEATLHVRITNSAYPTDTGVEEYSGPERITGPGTITEVLYGTVYEGDTEVFVGVDRRRPFRVFLLGDPSRVVLDVAMR